MFGSRKSIQEKKTVVDLGEMTMPVQFHSDARVKVVEVTCFDDLKSLSDMAYRGNVLVMDFSRFADGQEMKNELARQLLKVALNINGAFMEATDRLMVLSPGGLDIDRIRISHKRKDQ